jgi:hypothetical protein
MIHPGTPALHRISFMEIGTFIRFLNFIYFLESEFVSLILSGPGLVQEFSGNYNSAKVRKSLNQLASFLENLAEMSEPSILIFSSNISCWYRLLSGYPKHRKLVMKVFLLDNLS